MLEVQIEVQIHQVARREEEVETLRRELSQSLVEGTHCQTLHTENRSGPSESLSEIQQLRHERDSLTTRCRNLETET